jgi:hypothetical protein
MSYSLVHPNSTLRQDWDLLEEIVTVYRQLDVHQVKFEWVKGHQDTKNDGTDLSPQAVFNISSDAIATATTQAIGMTRVPELPLMFSTSTGKYWANLRLSAAEPAFFDYLTTKHQWDYQVVDTIDWDAFCMAGHTFSSTEVHLLKLVHDKLPLRKQVSRHQPWTSTQCHYCANHDTMDHLQTGICNPVSVGFRSDIYKKNRLYLQKRQCPPEFEKRFRSTLMGWLDPVQPQFTS